MIDSIITMMQDMIARIEETVADAYREALAKVGKNNLRKVRDAWMYRPGNAERFLRYKLEGRSTDEICQLEGAARRPWAQMLWPRRALDSACYVFAQVSILAT